LVVGEDEEVSIKQVTDAIVAAVGFEGEYRVCLFLRNLGPLNCQLSEESQFDPSRADGQFRKPASNQKLLSLLGDKFEFTPFDVALRDTVQWLVEHYDKDARIGQTKAGKHGSSVADVRTSENRGRKVL
jgi:GDP-L-fucose synthase